MNRVNNMQCSHVKTFMLYTILSIICRFAILNSLSHVSLILLHLTLQDKLVYVQKRFLLSRMALHSFISLLLSYFPTLCFSLVRENPFLFHLCIFLSHEPSSYPRMIVRDKKIFHFPFFAYPALVLLTAANPCGIRISFDAFEPSLSRVAPSHTFYL